MVEEKLGEGGFGEAWLAVHEKTRDRRVFKFCYDPASLRTLQREITLFRLLKEELGDREDISRIVDWSFDEAPYFIESEYTEGGNLVAWAEEQGGLAEISLAVRLEIVAQVATALAAAHSVLVLVARGHAAEAEALIDEAVDIYRKALPRHWRLHNSESVRGSVLAALERYDEAESLLVVSHSVLRDRTGERSPYTRDALKRLVVLYEAWGKSERAAEYRALVEAGGSS